MDVISALKVQGERAQAAWAATVAWWRRLDAAMRQGWDEADDLVSADGRPTPAPDRNPQAFYVGLTVVLLSCVSGFATYLILTGLTTIVPRNEVVVGVLFVNVLLVMAMVGVISWQVAGLLRAWRNKVAGTRLHVRIVGLFSIIAAIPAILLAVAATVTFSRSLDGWFSTRIKQIIDSSRDVATEYIEEHGQGIRTDLLNMSKDVENASDDIKADPRRYRELVLTQAGLRELDVAYLIDRTGRILVPALEDRSLPYQKPEATTFASADAGQVPVGQPRGTHFVAAMIKLSKTPGSYLYVARNLSPTVLGYLDRAEASIAEYDQLRRQRGGLKAAHAIMYFMISLTALLAAIWTGMWFASRFVAPIRRLISAAQQVSRGNLHVALPVIRGEGDLRRLSQTFNTMTSELKSQRDALVSANELLMQRRQFMEAVLTGVSAGVLGLDATGTITLANRSAEALLQMKATDLVGRTLADALPDFAEILAERRNEAIKNRTQQQLKMTVGGDERTFAVRFTNERGDSPGDEGSVITFDDISELVSAQRTSAWADVARRIAHEIKNPLTPIQLSAERIRRKYGKVITEDRETFDKLTATIERQVGDIKSMVDEFAAFARVPKPVIEPADVRDAVQEPAILFRESHQKVGYKVILPAAPVVAMIDRRLITQALTNLVKNATEAVEQAAEAPDREADWSPTVEVRLETPADRIVIEVIDNGVGLPKQNRSRLLEPYVTTKGSKGTGLGLAIVQKIVEQHGGVLALEDAPPAPGRSRGALVRITLPLRAVEQGAGAATTPPAAAE